MTNAEETDQRTLDDIKADAGTDGRRKGREAIANCEVKENELYKRWKESGDQRALRNALMEEAQLAESNGRQYSGHPIYQINRLDLEDWEYGEVTRAYEEGVSEGIKVGLEGRMEEEIVQHRESITPEDVLESLRETDGIEVVGEELDARHLLGYFEDYDPSLEDMRHVVKVWEGEETIEADHFFHDPDRYHATLLALSEAVGYHGVEAVRDGRGGKVLYHYANSGDTTLPEMYWSPDLEAWILADMETLASQGDPRLFHKREVEAFVF